MKGFIWVVATEQGGHIIASSGETIEEATESASEHCASVREIEPILMTNFKEGMSESDIEKELREAAANLMSQLENYGAVVTDVSDNLKN